MKIVFFGTSNVALPILEKLHQHHDVVAVVTRPDAIIGRKKELSESPVSVLAKEMEIRLFKPGQVRGNDVLRLELQDLKADVFIVVSYGKILPKEIIEIPIFKTLNVHFSLLPKYRGASPIQYALLSGDVQTGTSIMVLDEELDHGPVVTAEKYTVEPDDNFITLSERLAHLSAKLLHLALPDYSAGRLRPVEQDHTLATYTKIITRKDGHIDWNKSAQQIYNQFRAFYPWPGIWAVWNNKKLKITNCLPSAIVESGFLPGTILDGGFVACGNGTKLQILNIQLEGKTETDINSFMNGYKNFLEDMLS